MSFDQIHTKGSTSKMIEVALRSSATGQLLTSVAAANVTAKYQREGAAAAVTVSPLSVGTLGVWSSGGWIETQIPGLYQFGIPDLALATGADAVTLIFLAAGVIDAVKRIVLSGIAAEVWAYVTRTLTQSAAAAEVWAYVTRTLTQSAAAAASVTNPGVLYLTRGDTWSQAITGLGSLAGYTYLDFTVKEERETDLDAESIIRIRKATSGVRDGLLILNGAAGTAVDGSITINDATAGDITIALAARSTALLRPSASLYYDIQIITPTAITTLGEGILDIAADVTRSVA
jgi:hypothetical protein